MQPMKATLDGWSQEASISVAIGLMASRFLYKKLTVAVGEDAKAFNNHLTLTGNPLNITTAALMTGKDV